MPHARGLVAVLRRLSPTAQESPPAAAHGGNAGYGGAIDASIRLDEEIGKKLGEAVERTEAAAMAIMQQVRTLCDHSGELAGRLQTASSDAADFEHEVSANVAALERMTEFLECLPERLQRDLASINQIAGEIKSLSGLAEGVQAISMQSHLLSINAAIEASRAGTAGLAFKVVAEEVRMLAANSHAAASRIGNSLGRINGILKEGLAQNAEQSATDLTHIAETAAAVQQLRGSFARVNGSYHARFADMQSLGEAISHGSSEVLGQLQYQDVVRQCVERLREAVDKRNRVLGQAGAPDAPAPDLLAGLLADVVEEYLAGEAMHGGPADTGGGLAIELF